MPSGWSTSVARSLSLATLPLDDPAAYELLTRAETQGVFQLESAGMRDALRKLKPDCFEDIIAMVSLYRPGPMDNIPRYINVKHKLEDPSYLHPLLEPILAETNGVIIYQEQVMEIAKQLAGYTLGGADLLRRAMGKKIKAEMDAQREVFVTGAVERGIAPKLADTIFDAVAKFASYGFNKSHAAAYALLAYHTAWLKANHPVEFFAAAMTTECGNQEKLAAYRQEMRQQGVPLYPPDVNHSKAHFVVEDGGAGAGVRYALAAIKGVGSAAADQLVEEREARGPFRDVYDLMARLGTRVLNKRLLESLARAGAFDGLEPNRRRLFDGADVLLRYGAAAGEAAESDQVSLFGGSGAAQVPRPPMPAVEDWPALERLQMEFDVLGLYLSAHPLDGYRNALVRLGITTGDRLRQVAGEGGRVRLAGRDRQQAGAGDRADKAGAPDRLRPYGSVRGDGLQRADGTGARAAGRNRSALFRGRCARRRRQSAADRAAHPKTGRGRRPGAGGGRDPPGGAQRRPAPQSPCCSASRQAARACGWWCP